MANCCRAIGIAVWVGVTVCSAAIADATPTPVHAYEFRGDLSDSGTGGVAILSEGGVVGPEYFEFDPVYPGDYVEGLTLVSPALSNPAVYTIAMRLKYDHLRNLTPPGPYGPDQAWLKTIDFTDGLSSYGLYVEDVVRWEGPGLEGKVEFIASSDLPPFFSYPGVSPDGVVRADEWFEVVARRDAGGVFTCFVDGVEAFRFNDVFADALIDAPMNTLRFFQPDEQAILEYNVYEVNKGAIDYLRIYDEALSDAEVSALSASGLTGDYNNDGLVDAADYTAWRDHEGQQSSLPNDPVGGVVSATQYENWLDNYGVRATTTAAAAPSPSGVFLTIFVGWASCVPRRSIV